MRRSRSTVLPLLLCTSLLATAACDKGNRGFGSIRPERGGAGGLMQDPPPSVGTGGRTNSAPPLTDPKAQEIYDRALAALAGLQGITFESFRTKAADGDAGKCTVNCVFTGVGKDARIRIRLDSFSADGAAEHTVVLDETSVLELDHAARKAVRVDGMFPGLGSAVIASAFYFFLQDHWASHLPGDPMGLPMVSVTLGRGARIDGEACHELRIVREMPNDALQLGPLGAIIGGEPTRLFLTHRVWVAESDSLPRRVRIEPPRGMKGSGDVSALSDTRFRILPSEQTIDPTLFSTQVPAGYRIVEELDWAAE